MNGKYIHIRKGDVVGVVAPSRFVRGSAVKINKGILRLVRSGFKVEIGTSFREKYYSAAGDRFIRAKDLNRMFEDNKIKAIFCAIGGDATNQILDLLDYEMIKKNPKPIIGYSDITHLLLAIYKKTGITTYHGPNLNLLATVTKSSVKQLMEALEGETNQKNYFSECKVIKSGKATGKLIGGNLFVINNLDKTEFGPDYKGSVLFWEDINEGLSSIEYQLYQLGLSGILKDVNGMIIGHIDQPGSERGRPLKEMILEITKEYDFPVLKTSIFGHHVKKFVTFPIGVTATIDTDKKYFGWE